MFADRDRNKIDSFEFQSLISPSLYYLFYHINFEKQAERGMKTKYSFEKNFQVFSRQ